MNVIVDEIQFVSSIQNLSSVSLVYDSNISVTTLNFLRIPLRKFTSLQKVVQIALYKQRVI
jgi:hypothetical protein